MRSIDMLVYDTRDLPIFVCLVVKIANQPGSQGCYIVLTIIRDPGAMCGAAVAIARITSSAGVLIIEYTFHK